MFSIDEIIDQYGDTIKELGYGRRQLADWLNDNVEGKYTEHFARRLLAELDAEEEAPTQKNADQRSMEDRLRDIYGLQDESWVPVSVWGDPNNPRAKWERRMDLVEADKMQAILEKTQALTLESAMSVPSDRMAVLSIRDTHFGMFTEHPGPYDSYDLEEAQWAYVQAGRYLMREAAESGVSHLVIPFGSDTLHVDNNANTTTKGTPQEMTTAWWRAFEAAMQSIITVAVEASEQFEAVTLVLEQGNHDENMARSLAMAVQARFVGYENVNVMASFDKMKRVSVGERCHVFMHHGDTMHPSSYPAIIYADHPEVAKRGSYVEVLSGHLHHRKKATLKQAGDYLEDGGIVHRITPALCPSSDWAQANGYRSVPGAQLTVYDEDGFVSLFDWTPARGG